jgi:deoxyribonuclease V
VGAVAVLVARTLRVLEVRTASLRIAAPYMPGLLAFREVPPIRAAFRKLSRRPDLLLVDGSGLIHPRRCGLACHLGLVLDVPSIGCAKSPFVGEWEEPAAARGSWSPVRDGGETVGAVLRTRDGLKPLFVSDPSSPIG